MVLGTYQRIAILLRRTISDHLPRSRHETILNVLQRIRLRSLSRLRLASDPISFASLRRDPLAGSRSWQVFWLMVHPTSRAFPA